MKQTLMVILVGISMLNAGDFKVKSSMVYDSKTELSWQKKPSSKKMKWQEAKTHCEDLELRLPNLYELKSLVDYKKRNPAIRTNLIDIKTDDWYWSSSEYKGKSSSSSAWNVRFNRGLDYWNGKASTDYVLCVSGQ